MVFKNKVFKSKVFKNKVFNGFQSQVEEHLVFVKIDYFAKTMSLTSVPPSGRTPGLTMVFKNKVFSGFQSQVGEHLNSQWFSKTRFSIVFKATWENTLFLSKQYFVQVYRQVGEHRIFSMLRLRLEDMGSVKMQTICRVCIESTQFFPNKEKRTSERYIFKIVHLNAHVVSQVRGAGLRQ